MRRFAVRLKSAPVLAFGAGLLIATGQAPLFLWPLAGLGLILASWLFLRAPTPRAAAWIGWATGLGMFLAALSWLIHPFLVEPTRHAWMIPFALPLMAGGLALFWAFAFFLAKIRNSGALSLAALWGLAELARGTLFTGFPWAMPGYIWIDQPLSHVAAFIGPYGLTALTFVLAALIAHSFTVRRWPAAALAFALFAGLSVLGNSRAQMPLPQDQSVAIRVVQPNAPQRLKWDPDHVTRFYERALELSDAEGAALVIWPETALSVPLYAADPYLYDIATRTAPARAVVGLNRVNGTRGYNSAVFLDAHGVPEQIYDKHHLVPFGEYIPLPGLLEVIGFRAFTAKEGYGYSAGPGPRVIDTGVAGRVLPLICYEAIFPRDLRASERPDWLLQMTNDAWFGTHAGPQQSLVQSRFRAIETGLPMVRAANTGISGVIDPHGKMRAAIALGTSGALTAPLPGALPAPPYARFGEAPVILLLMTLMLFSLIAPRTRCDRNSD